MPKHKNTATLPAEPALDQERINNAMTVMIQSATADANTQNREIFDLGCQVGAIQLSRLTRSFLRAGEIKLFAEACASKAWRLIPVKQDDGSVRAADSVRDFTRLAFGKSYAAMAERQQNLAVLGEEAYEAAQSLGLRRDQLRLIRSLPADQQAAVQEALASNSPTEVLTLVENLAASVAERDALLVEAKQEAQATAKVLQKRNEVIDKLHTAQHRIARAKPDEKLAEVKKEASQMAFEAQAAVMGNLRLALQAVLDATTIGDETVFMAGLVGSVQAEVTKLRDSFGLPDMSTAVDAELAAEVAQWADKP